MTKLRRRDRLAGWLGLGARGGQPMVQGEAGEAVATGDPALVMPPADQAQQRVLAGRYFSHAEELIRRGAAELSAPYYRQAYALLCASAGLELPGESPAALVHLAPVAPAAPVSAAPPAIPGQMESHGALQQIRELRAALSASTAETTAIQVAQLRAKGVNHPDLHHLDGLAALLRQDPQRAEACFRQALAMAPGHYGSLVSLAGLLLGQQQLDQAQQLLNAALAVVNPESSEAVPALTNLSLVHQAAGRRMDEALLLLKIHRLKPGHVRDRRLLTAAETLAEMAEEPAAIELLQWLAERPQGEQALQPLATLLERRGDYQAAALVYRRLLTPPGGAAPAGAS